MNSLGELFVEVLPQRDLQCLGQQAQLLQEEEEVPPLGAVLRVGLRWWWWW